MHERDITLTTDGIQGYRDLSLLLRGQIESGHYPSGSRLPTEMEMSRWYGINRHTVRAALQDLEQQGYLYRVRGKGTFVARRKLPYAICPSTSFSSLVTQTGAECQRTVLNAACMPATADLAKRLEIRVNDEVVSLEILRSLGHVPACVTTSYLPHSRFPDLVKSSQNLQSLYGLLKQKYDIKEIRRCWSEIEAVMPQPRDQEALQMPSGMPILLTRSLIRDETAKPMEYCVSRNRGDAYTLRVDL